ncbi:MAG: tetratricopeptide repeat protein, partial [Terriglobus roseus]|nr:tetratricopeptide repeat protein [Terriglobus roseus]
MPDVPSPAVFNHVITTVMLPSGRIWLDSTAEVAPFQYLVPPIRDQEALVVPEKGTATLVKTPAAPPYAFTGEFSAKGELSADGTLHASMTGTYRDDEEVLLRALARNLAPAEWDKGSQFVSYQTGFSGTTSNTRFRGANNLDSPMEVTYDYMRKQYGNWDAHQIVPLFPAVTLTGNSDETKEPEHDLQLGVPRKDVAVSRIRIPAGWHVDLPDAVHEKSTWATFDKTYRFVSGEIVTERTVTVLQPKVPRASWKQYQTFCKAVDLGNENWITLLPSTTDATPANKAVSSTTEHKDEHGNVVSTVTFGNGTSVPAAPSDASIADLKQTAWKQLQNRQVSDARATLDRIRQKDPKQDLTLYDGWLAQQNGDWKTAIEDYRKELAAHPDEIETAQSLAWLQQAHEQSAEAQETLLTMFRRHPEDLRLGYSLAFVQAEREQHGEQVNTFETMLKQHPDDVRVKVALGNALLAADRKDEAAAVAKAALDGTTDPGILNDAGYLLAETGEDLPQAEAVSRKSIGILEEKSRATTPDQMNSNSFAQSNLLIADWDTLGWILFREGKLDEAETYVTASWRNSQHPEVGEHLGRVLEQRGDLPGAVEQYRNAQAAIEGNNASPAVRKLIANDLVRLQASVTPELTSATKSQLVSLQKVKG